MKLKKKKIIMWKKKHMYDLNQLLWPMLCMFLGQFNIGILINFLASEKRPTTWLRVSWRESAPSDIIKGSISHFFLSG